jgi:Zinc carboxypeptidase
VTTHPLRRGLIAALGVFVVSSAALSKADDAWPQTRPERTGYRETSSLADVTALLHDLKAKGAPIVDSTIGRSAGGRPLVMAVMSRPAVADGAAARKAGKLVVYVQANIHGGEVEGKEAVLMLLRSIARNDEGAGKLLDRLVLVAVPVFNVDGNETLGDGARIRPSQDGPDRVGQRSNGAGLDLNRDAVKITAPETRAVLQHVYRAWDPALTFDLHTTNGTRHGFLLTYAPPLNPNTEPGVLAYGREGLQPAVRAGLKHTRGWAVFDYGNLETRGGERAWYTFGEEGRYVTNYVGLRNRLAVLSEAASFQPFRTRVETTLGFVRAVLQELADNADRVGELTRAADANVVAWGLDPLKAPRLGVRFEPQSPRTEPVPLEVLPAGTQVDHRKAPAAASLRSTPLPVYDRFHPTRTAKYPAAYIVPEGLTGVVSLLRWHGVAVDRLDVRWEGQTQRFVITESVTRRQAFQGGSLTRLEGQFEPVATTVPPGSYLVRTAQPLGLLVFHLLEPEGLDGASAWGFLGDAVAKPGAYPILKVMTPVRSSTEPVP